MEVYKEIHEMSKSMEDILAEFSKYKGEPINKVFEWYMDDQYSEIRTQLAEWYISKTIHEGSERVTEETFAQWMIIEVESYIERITKCLQNECAMMLTLVECQDLLQELNKLPLNKLPVFDSDLRDKRILCKMELERVEQELIDMDREKTEQNEGCSERVLFPLTTLLDYTIALEALVTDMPSDKGHTNDYWKMEIVRSYFRLTSVLNPIIAPTKTEKLVTIGVHKRKKIQLKIPRNGWVVFMISVIKYMLPIYFAAKLVQQRDKGIETQYYSMGSGQYIQEEKVERQLRDMYMTLLDSKKDSVLGNMMEYIGDKVIEQYINWLERQENG